MKLFAELDKRILLNKQVHEALGVELDLILEANVANIKQPIGSDLSINSYLTKFAKEIPQELRAPFIKKLTQLLINDERFLYAMREVPQGAPEWVTKAVADGQLMVFQPNADLNDKMTHMVHFIATADHDSKQTANNDQRVFAQRELAGFGKAENLDLLIKKSNEYFARGSRSAKRDESGMTKVFDSGGGYTWWNLVDPAAFQREGKTLQNCIGRNYTAETCARDNTSIIVLRDPKGNTVVAARLRNLGEKSYEVEEMKGKQNKPPIEEYMPPVIDLINRMKIKIGRGAASDFEKAGYIYYNEKLYPVEQAIKELTHATEISPMKNGNKLVAVTADVQGLLGRMYAGIHYYSDPNTNKVYESRNSKDEPLITFITSYNEISHITAHKTGRAVASVTEDQDDVTKSKISSNTRQIVQEMYQILREKIPGIKFNYELSRKLNWIHHLVPNRNDELEDFSPDEQMSSDDTGDWDVHSDQHKLSSLDHAMPPIRRPEREYRGSDFTKIYRYKSDGEVMTAFGLTKDKNIVPFFVDKESGRIADTLTYGYDHANYYDDDSRTRNPKMLRALINVANEHGYTIPQELRTKHLIIKNHKGQYDRFKPEPTIVSENPKVLKYDLTQYPAETRQDVFTHINKDNDYDPRAEEERTRYNRRPAAFEGAALSPDSLVYMDISYGVEKQHTMVMAIKGNTIESLDDSSKQKTWQAWGDYQVVADQINKFAADHKLNISARLGSRSKEFTVIDGKVATKSADIQRKAEKRALRGSKEGTDEIKFADGKTLKKMSAEDQASLMRKDLRSSTNRGDLWVSSDSYPRFGLFVSNGKIQRVVNMTGSTLEYGVPAASAIPLIKAAANTFGWTNQGVDLSLKKGSDEMNYLKSIAASGDEGKDISHAPGKNGSALVRKGLVSFHQIDRYNKKLKLTTAGRNAINALNANTPVNVLDGAPAAELDPTFVKPTKPTPATPSATVAGLPRRAPTSLPLGQGGTKADLAVAKFRQMMQTSGSIPSASQFIPVLMAEPFNMSKLGAQTYYYNTKKKVGSQTVGEGSHLMSAFLTPGMTMLKEFQEI
jgi:hypothetical protein